MKIKFNKDVVLINSTLAIAIGTDTALTPECCLPKDDDGNTKYFDGATPIGISKYIKYPVKAGTIISIDANYSYNKESNELSFRCKQELGSDYKFCFPDLIDETCYYVENLVSSDFKILE